MKHQNVLKILSFVLLAGILLLSIYRCSYDKNKEIQGTITEYCSVEEYTNPLAIISGDDGNTYVAAFFESTVVSDAQSHFQDEILKELLEGTLTGIDIEIIRGEEGKNVQIKGERVTVYQAYSIRVLNAD